MVDLNRRALLRVQLKPIAPALRMPWLCDETEFLQRCTQCQACLKACPEKIIVVADGGYPALNFQHGECSFCYECADSCPEALFTDQQQPAWEQQARINTGSCLAHRNVMCRSCEDSCEPQAITFPPRLASVAQPLIDSGLCTGCGACVSACPQHAITMTQTSEITPTSEVPYGG